MNRNIFHNPKLSAIALIVAVIGTFFAYCYFGPKSATEKKLSPADSASDTTLAQQRIPASGPRTESKPYPLSHGGTSGNMFVATGSEDDDTLTAGRSALPGRSGPYFMPSGKRSIGDDRPERRGTDDGFATITSSQGRHDPLREDSLKCYRYAFPHGAQFPRAHAIQILRFSCVEPKEFYKHEVDKDGNLLAFFAIARQRRVQITFFDHTTNNKIFTLVDRWLTTGHYVVMVPPDYRKTHKGYIRAFLDGKDPTGPMRKKRSLNPSESEQKNAWCGNDSDDWFYFISSSPHKGQ